jgi:hypothetical protein
MMAIDSSNIVTDAFHRIMKAADSVGVVASSVERSRLYMNEARLFAAIDLPEQALDAADHALYERPQSVDADLFESAVFKQKNRTRRAAQCLREAIKAGASDPAVASELAEIEQQLQ